jgi:hypothetical protein
MEQQLLALVEGVGVATQPVLAALAGVAQVEVQASVEPLEQRTRAVVVVARK